MNLKDYIDSYPDFPKPGVIFRDIMPLLRSPEAVSQVVDDMADILFASGTHPDAIVAPEARGFILGALVAHEIGVPFIPARKQGKLPGQVFQQEYTLEYGTSIIEIPAKAIEPCDKIVIIDDLIALGGTIKAVADLVEKMGGEVIHILSLIELPELNGRNVLSKYRVSSLITYEGE